MVMPTANGSHGGGEANKRKSTVDESDDSSDWTQKKIRLEA
jgi:hypothetical protein